MVIDGVLDPRQWSSGWQIKTDRVGSYHVLLEFFRQCDLAGKDCVLRGNNGSKARFDAILAVARQQGTIVIGEGDDVFEYGYDEVVADASSLMYSPEQWPAYANFLDLLSNALTGDKLAPSYYVLLAAALSGISLVIVAIRMRRVRRRV